MPPVSHDPASSASDHVRRQIALLGELAEIGMDLVREVRRRTLEAGPDAPTPAAPDLAYARFHLSGSLIGEGHRQNTLHRYI